MMPTQLAGAFSEAPATAVANAGGSGEQVARTGGLRRYQAVSIAFRTGDPFPILPSLSRRGLFFSVVRYSSEPPPRAPAQRPKSRRATADSSRLALVTSWWPYCCRISQKREATK
jgi:hypothetical protein